MSFPFKRNFGPVPKYDRVIEYDKHSSKFTVIAGPCSVENETQIWKLAGEARGHATHLRGGVFRAGTYPSNSVPFGWIDREIVESYHQAAKKFNLKNVIELLDYRDVDFVSQYCDVIQIGARQQQNYTLLKVAAESGKPVFLKRNPGASLDELLGSAEWLLKFGAKEIVLIERGSYSFHNHVRWDLSVSMIPAVKAITKIPIVVDASHGTGRRDLVAPMTLAGVAAGADGCLVEFHDDPDKSLSDAEQALSVKDFHDLMFRVSYLKENLNEMPSLRHQRA